MSQNTRDRILNRLKKAGTMTPDMHVELPPLPHAMMDSDELVQSFILNVTAAGAEVHHVEQGQDMSNILTEIIKDTELTRFIVNDDTVFKHLELDIWAAKQGLALIRASEFNDRRSYTDAVFDVGTAGFTTVDYAVAESGTLVIGHHQGHARLISLAPMIHIVLVRTDQIVPVYDDVIAQGLFNDEGPSQVTWITGPSMTADIQATPFKGMHGPKRLVVLLRK
ncbi:MAG: lactate utilization protein [Proteobacteria bacterium]|nr:lactate utilization protein [Pseudomonadota bacterium]